MKKLIQVFKCDYHLKLILCKTFLNISIKKHSYEFITINSNVSNSIMQKP